MSVEKRTNGDGTRSYKVRWREGDRARARSFRTLRDAELFDADLVRRQRLGTLAALDAGTMTLDRFIANTWAPQRAADLKPATRAFYAAIYRAHIAPTFATVPLREITPQRIAAWQAGRVKAGGGRTAIKQALTLLGGILGYAVELEHLQANAARAVWDNWRRNAFNAARLGDLVPYDLRHTFASLLLAEGRAIHYVAEQLGHSAQMTLRTYGHVIADYRDRDAIDAEAEIRAARGLTCPLSVHEGVAALAGSTA